MKNIDIIIAVEKNNKTFTDIDYNLDSNNEKMEERNKFYSSIM